MGATLAIKTKQLQENKKSINFSCKAIIGSYTQLPNKGSISTINIHLMNKISLQQMCTTTFCDKECFWQQDARNKWRDNVWHKTVCSDQPPSTSKKICHPTSPIFQKKKKEQTCDPSNVVPLLFGGTEKQVINEFLIKQWEVMGVDGYCAGRAELTRHNLFIYFFLPHDRFLNDMVHQSSLAVLPLF